MTQSGRSGLSARDDQASANERIERRAIESRELGSVATDQERAFGDYGPGRFAWLLADIRALPEPIPEPVPKLPATMTEPVSYSEPEEAPAAAPAPPGPVRTYKAPRPEPTRCGGWVLTDHGWVLDTEQEV